MRMSNECQHLTTRYQLGHTYCARCGVWLHAGKNDGTGSRPSAPSAEPELHKVRDGVYTFAAKPEAPAPAPSAEPPQEKKWWNGGPLPKVVDPKKMSEEYARALYKEPLDANIALLLSMPPCKNCGRDKIAHYLDGDSPVLCDLEGDRRYDAPSADPQYRCGVCGNHMKLGPRDEMVIHFLPCKHSGSSYESSPVDLQHEAEKWWSQHQDDFISLIAGTGLATHSLYDVPAALAAFAAHLRGK